jgi:hypothetical protein
VENAVSFKDDLDQALFGGAEPSWEDIRADARRLLRATKVDGGEQADYDKAMDHLIKPTRGEFADEEKLLAEAVAASQVTYEERVVENYWGDVLQSFANGVQLDLRVKLAVDFLKSPAFQGAEANPEAAASRALTLATELLEQAQAAGLVKPLPDDDELNAAMKRHLSRNVRAQLYGQEAAQRIQGEPKVAMGGTLPADFIPRRQ